MRSAHASGEPPRREVANVLLLEDEKSFADLVVRKLRKIEWARVRVRRAERLQSALSSMADQAFDLVIADLNLPDSAGLGTLERLVDVATQPIIVVTGLEGDRLREQAVKAGAYDLILKTRFDPTVLEDAMRHAVVHAKSLHRSEAKYRALIEQAADGIFMTDSHGRFLLANRRYCEMLRYGESELLGMSAVLTFPEDEQASARARIPRLKTDLLYERMIRRKDGTLFPAEISVRVLPDGTHHGIARDITERKRFEAALRDSESRFRETFELAASGIAHVDLDGRFLRVNRKMCEILGYAEQELVGRSVKEISHPEDRDVTDAQRARVRRAETDAANFEKRYLRKDGSVAWVSLTVALARHADGTPRYEISVMEDVTERKIAEEHVARLTRVHAVLSSINALIVRTRDRGQLFREACELAVAKGRFQLAWIGMKDGDKIRIEASAGADDGYLELMPLALDGGRVGLNAQAIADGRPRVVNDIATDARFLLRKEALKRRFRSFATLPLVVEGKAAGLLALYGEQPGFFDDEEMKLLTELAGDIAFAMEHIAKAERVQQLAYYDELTGLTNQRLLREHIAQRTGTAKGERRKFGLTVLNIERFRNINETLGRQAGDELLRQFAGRLAALSGDAKYAARIGADTFAVLIPAFRDEEELARLIEKGQQQISEEEFAFPGSSLRVSTKAGIAVFPADGADPETLLRNAEAALKRAKQSAEPYLFYAAEMTSRVADKLALENKLRRALQNEEFVLHYQPKVDARKRSVVGVEALLRWQNPELGMVGPMDFIPLLEETGLILPVGAWALRRAAADQRRWVEAGFADVRVAVNVSPMQLRRRDFVESVEQAIPAAGSPAGIDLEITESLIMEDAKPNIEKLQRLRALGLDVAIDDFGTGYSSLGYLTRLPVQSLKIDRSFVANMASDASSGTLVLTIISLAHSLGLKVVAEGVETEEQANLLRGARCDELQGYLISKPLPFDRLIEFLADYARRGAVG